MIDRSRAVLQARHPKVCVDAIRMTQLRQFIVGSLKPFKGFNEILSHCFASS
jgi:hypothetical protein